jgi:outer membrane biosynthesis protein TonB
MRLLEKFLLLSRGKQIALVVCMIHCLLVLALFGHHLFTRQLRPPRPMVVRTLAAQPPPRAIASAPTPKAAAAKAKPPAPVKKAAAKATPAAKAAVKSAPPKTILAKPAPVHKPVQEELLLQEIAESLETLSAETMRTRTALTVPSKVQSKAEIAPTSLDPTYGELLIAYLQNELDLPEYGEVKAKIEIDRFGRLIDCQILEAKSAKNAEFLKNRLPELAFPCLNDTQSFTITFRNVEIY